MPDIDGLDYRKAFVDLVTWVRGEIEVKPRQVLESPIVSLETLHKAKGQYDAYQAVLVHAEMLLDAQLHPENYEEDPNG